MLIIGKAEQMIEERTITRNGQTYTVVISDEQEALLAADAAGRAILGLWHREEPSRCLAPAAYLIEDLQDVDELLLERVVCRKEGFPWRIGETKRLRIREFSLSDSSKVWKEAEDEDADRIFYEEEKLRKYIRCQYGFYEFGLWALEEKETGALVGKAGITKMDDKGAELAYHIFTPYRGNGYGVEACKEICRYVKTQMNCGLYAKIDPSNEASIRLIEKCGFSLKEQKCNEEDQSNSLCFWNCLEWPM